MRDRKLCAIATSNGYGVADLWGISTRAALAFLWSLASVKQKSVLVAFDSAVDFELLLRDLTKTQKNRLFGITRRLEERAKDTPLYEPAPVNGREIAEALGYRMSMLLGKVFRLARPKKTAVTVFDIEAFFGGANFRETVRKFLGKELILLEGDKPALWNRLTERALLDRCVTEAGYVAELAAQVDKAIEPLDLNLRQWYGPSAIAARCLTKWGARKEAKRLHEKNSASELLKAIDCAFFGSRVELIKNGTIKNVKTFDLNSAFAYAVTLLSKFYKPLRFTRRYRDSYSEPFSCWLVDYDLPEAVSLGVLPTRSTTGAISYRKTGRGYFWQPEVDYLRQRYPESFNVKWGYVGSYEQVSFAPKVYDLYDYRMQLKEAGDYSEGVIKLALANLYGKFAQNTGSAHFQCRAWAGWITSLVRRLMLEAVTGIEDRVISFNQDAVHLTGAEAAGITIGTGLGQWKRQEFAEGFYIAPGFQYLYSKAEAKSATRGINLSVDWWRAAVDLSERHVAALERSFFVGWNLAQTSPHAYGDKYLQEVREAFDIVPTRLRARNYEAKFDWCTEHRTSTINRRFDGELSRRYVPQDVNTGALKLRVKDSGWRS